jgi:methionyl-tRNA formyltransferase
MKIAFFGTPEFAVPCLDMLVKNGYDVVGVFCQPDRKSGRGHKVSFSPVKKKALIYNLPVFQYEKIKSKESINKIKELDIDLMITVAYGQILSQEILDIPKLGCINVHASLLPKYRGAAPIQWVLMNGETKTGITTMFTDVGLDTGDMLLKQELSIGDSETGGELYEKLAFIGAEVLEKTLVKLKNGTLKREKQNEAESSYYPLLNKDMLPLSFKKTAKELINKVRALDPVMRCYVDYKKDRIKLLKLGYTNINLRGKPGEILVSDHKQGLIVMAKDKPIEVLEIQFPGGKRMRSKDYLLGKKIPVGDMFE